jgi:hypothetical protein
MDSPLYTFFWTLPSSQTFGLSYTNLQSLIKICRYCLSCQAPNGWVEGFLVNEAGAHHQEQFFHTGDEGDHLGLAPGKESLIGLANDRVVLGRNQSWHVEGFSQLFVAFFG